VAWQSLLLMQQHPEQLARRFIDLQEPSETCPRRSCSRLGGACERTIVFDLHIGADAADDRHATSERT
jgi:hypothetical protein